MDRGGGSSMWGRLRRVLVCTPETAGWRDPERAARWRELGYLHPPEPERAEAQHRALVELLERSGAEVLFLAEGEGLSLDAVYAHDASLASEGGMVLMRMGKSARSGEPAAHAALYRSIGAPVLGAIERPGAAESGDIVWLDAKTLLVGRGYRTNGAAIEQLGALFRPRGVEVVASPLPHGPGPGACLHLMSLMSVLDERTALVDLPWLSVPTVELLRRLEWELIEIDPSERETMAANVLALGGKRLVALEENRRTNQKLRAAGFEVMTFPGSELCQNGSGGPTCLTRPLVRE